VAQPEICLFERATGLAVNQLEPQRDLRQRLLQVVVLAIPFVIWPSPSSW